MTGFTKLFGSILQSTVWREDLPTKIVWITLLALADRDGIVEAAIPGLAHLAGVDVEQAEAALDKFQKPDKYSRSPENEGRRIEAVRGGWRLLNYDKYREKLSPEEVREKNRIRQQRYRDRRRSRESTESDDERDAESDPCVTDRDMVMTGSDSRHSLRRSRHSRSRSRGRNNRNTGAGAAGAQAELETCVQTQDAVAMLNVFESVGAATFDITVTDLKGEKINFRRNQGIKMLRGKIGSMLQRARDDEHNLIVRPRPGMFRLVQLDDLDLSQLERVIPFAFLAIRTSPNNHQAWVAVKDAGPDFARVLRKGAGADPSASGATRIAGSVNFKPDHAPYFPVVELAHVGSTKVVTMADLETGGLVAPPEKSTQVCPNVGHVWRDSKKWPSYEMCLKGAPPIHRGTRPDISKADFVWCMIAIQWGWSVDETARRLMHESAKARENGPRYALLTAQKATAV